MLDILKTKVTLVAATLGLIITIGGAFTWYGEINARLSNIEKNMGSDTSGVSISQNVKSILENDKNNKINAKEIELLKLQIREIQSKSGNPLSN